MLLVKLIVFSMGLITLSGSTIAKINVASISTITRLRTINQGSNSGIHTEHFEVIRDNESLLKLWQLHTEKITQSKSTTPVIDTTQLESLSLESTKQTPSESQLLTLDFNKEMLIAAFAGTKNSGGYSIKVTQVNLLDDSIEINILLIKPSNNCMVTNSITQPYTMVAAKPISDKPAHFNLQIKSKNCDTGALE